MSIVEALVIIQYSVLVVRSGYTGNVALVVGRELNMLRKIERGEKRKKMRGKMIC